MNKVQCVLTGFANSSKHEGYKVIFTKVLVKDAVFGVDKVVRRTYTCIQSYLFSNFIGSTVELELTKAPTTGEYVVTSIKEVA